MMEFLKDDDFMFGLVVFILGLVGLIKSLVDRKTAIRLSGKVVKSFTDKYGVYFPIISFYYEDQEYNIQGSIGSKKPKYVEGQDVEIFFKPKNQKNVMVVGNNYDIFFFLVLAICGLGMAICRICMH